MRTFEAEASAIGADPSPLQAMACSYTAGLSQNTALIRLEKIDSFGMRACGHGDHAPFKLVPSAWSILNERSLESPYASRVG